MSLAIKSINRGFARIFNLPRLSLSLIVALGSTLGAVLCVAAISSALMLKPLPGVSNAHNLYDIELEVTFGGALSLDFITPHALHHANQHFKDVGEWTAIDAVQGDVSINNINYKITTLTARDNAPKVLGNSLLLGKNITTQNLDSHVWLSQSLWKSAYNGLDNVIGKSIVIGNKTYLIGGVFEDTLAINGDQQVLPQQLWFFKDYAQAAPFNNASNIGSGALKNVLLKPFDSNTKLPTDEEIMAWFNGYVDYEISVPHLKDFIKQMPMTSSITDYRKSFLDTNYYLVIALGITAFGLLIMATLNLINLFLSYYQSRTKEFAMQLTLGASANKLRWLMVLENLPSFALAGVLGTLLGSWLIKALPLFTNNKLPLLNSISIDAFTAALCVTLVTALAGLFGFISLTHIDKKQLQANLSSSGKGTAVQTNHTVSRLLMVLQISIASLLCTGSVMLAKQSFDYVYEDLGFTLKDTRNIEFVVKNKDWLKAMTDARTENRDVPEYQSFVDSIKRDLETRIADSKVLLANEGGILGGHISLRSEQMTDDPNQQVTYSVKRYDAGYFEAMGIAVLAGTIPSQADISDNTRRYVVGERFAKELYPNQVFSDIIGQAFPFDETRVVGAIVEKTGFKNSQIAPTIYTPYLNVMDRMSFTVAIPDDAAIDFEQLKAHFDKNYPDIQLDNITTLTDIWFEMTAQKRLTLYILIAVTLLTILLAAIGINGLTLMTTHQKKYELAIRMATGAKQMALIRFVLKDALPLFIVGLISGFLLSVFGYDWFKENLSLLPDFNWLTLTFLDIGLVIVVLLSVLIPTWRVIRQDPLSALRQE